MALTKKQVSDVCCEKKGSLQCRYLDEEYDSKGLVKICRKLSPDAKIIDAECSDYINNAIKSGRDPAVDKLPLGNNCQGYIVLLTKPQGYDVKP